MTVDTARLRETIREALAAGPPLRLAILFGSCARDALHSDSDIDIGIVPRDPDVPLSAELELQARLEQRCQRRVDVVRLDRASTLLRWEAGRDAVLVLAQPPTEFPRFRASSALEHAEFLTTLADGGERFRRRLAAIDSPARAAAGTTSSR